MSADRATVSHLNPGDHIGVRVVMNEPTGWFPAGMRDTRAGVIDPTDGKLWVEVTRRVRPSIARVDRIYRDGYRASTLELTTEDGRAVKLHVSTSTTIGLAAPWR